MFLTSDSSACRFEALSTPPGGAPLLPGDPGVVEGFILAEVGVDEVVL